MASALCTTVVGGVVGTGILFHIGRLFLAIVVGLVAYAAARWIYLNYS